jgi:hypothetical protein
VRVRLELVTHPLGAGKSTRKVPDLLIYAPGGDKLRGEAPGR